MPKANERNKTLSYRRAVYFAQVPGMPSLEVFLKDALALLTTISQRTIATPGYPIIECRSAKSGLDGVGCYLHLATYTPGEYASIVTHQPNANQLNVETAAPPDNADFMDGDMMVLVVDNNVFICSTNAHEKTAERFMQGILKKADTPPPSAEFILRKVGDINKLQMIQSSGVKAITLDADIFDATLDAMERQTVSSKLSGSLMDELKALVLKDYGQEELDRAENLTAKIVITYDKRKKKAVLGREALESIAAKIVDEEDDNGFMIKTLSGETIRGSQIAVRTSVPLPKHGKSVWRDAAWDALNTYYLQLRENNTLEE